MSNYDFLRKVPFSLNDQGMNWVETTLSSLTTEEKAGQLFCLCAREGNRRELDEIYSILKPGGIMYRPFPIATAIEFTALLDEYANVPMLVAANLEKGGNGIVYEGTMMHAPLGLAACHDDEEQAKRLGTLCGREGAAVGANWAFAPIIDIDYNFRNPITNTRTFGSDPDRVLRMGRAYVEAVQAQGLAASIKHFPGDGCDERDQHLLSSVNDLSADEWDATYGQIYKASIDAGAMTVMIGHIMQPAWSRKINPALRDEEILPASLSPELMQGLLRGKLGFNGLICTDATSMAGFTIPMPRSKAVPASIAAGADVFLFARNLREDFEDMLAGIADGTITPKRLDEAVARILGLKAALGLHTRTSLPTQEQAGKIVGCAEHRRWASEAADRAVTLVKEEAGILPITVERYPRILYFPIESEQGIGYSVREGASVEFANRLREQGFEVTVFEPDNFLEGKVRRFDEYAREYDLMLYLANMSTKSNQTTVRIEWQQPMGANCPHWINDVPTVFVSVENPYHLLDVPRVKTFVNAYGSSDDILQACVDKLTGRSDFAGSNPVDPFCGRWDTRL